MYAVHQVVPDPRQEHGEAIVYIVKYLKATRHIGLCFKPDASKGFDATVTLTLQAIGTRSLQKLTLALQNLGVDG
eukprot:CCRYP_018906-RA/>CCRYP_018906-RA protein AED:0.44 eAED:0.44 QI:0/-1/0/1/-1/1/1/0/74